MCIDIFEATMGNRYEVQGRQAKYSYKSYYMHDYGDDYYSEIPETCTECMTQSVYNDTYTKTKYCMECEKEFSYESDIQTL
jgi:hypothetical protein